MKIFALTLLLVSTPAFGVDLHILMDKAGLEKWGVKLAAEKWANLECTSYSIAFPSINGVSELAQPFSSASYLKWSGSTDPYKIKSDFRLPLATTDNAKEMYIKNVCITEKELESAYVAISYSWGQGHPPTVIYIKLSAVGEM